MLFEALKLIVAWVFFVFATINMTVYAVLYLRDDSRSVGWWAFTRMVMVGVAYALWWGLLK